jgi:hypothetical protein
MKNMQNNIIIPLMKNGIPNDITVRNTPHETVSSQSLTIQILYKT